MLKDIVEQKERLFAPWPWCFKTSHNGTGALMRKKQHCQAVRRNMENRSVRKEDFVKRQVDMADSFLLVPSFSYRFLWFTLCQVSFEEWKSWNEVFGLLEQRGEVLSPGTLEKTRSLGCESSPWGDFLHVLNFRSRDIFFGSDLEA